MTLALGGCAVSGGMGSMFASKRDDAQLEAQARALISDDVTGSIASPRMSKAGAASETDLLFARMAIVEVLGRGIKHASAPWENPSSGARGTVTPIAAAYNRDGSTCHDFLASYVRQGTEAWYQGQACHASKGKWEVQSLRPWTRT